MNHMLQRMIIMRGLPGSGKSTHVATVLRHVYPAAAVVSADDYFVDPVSGEYRFDPKRIGEAHAACQEAARRAIAGGRTVIVDNTNTQAWEMRLYVRMAEDAGIRCHIVSTFDGGGMSDEELAARNSHGVPVAAIARMRARWEKHPSSPCVTVSHVI